jgi:peroxiredoxin
MIYLWMAVVVVGAVCVVDLVLTFGVIRRLREHTELLNQRIVERAAAPGPIMLEAGATVGDFSVSTTDGVTVSRADLTGPRLVGFFSPACSACTENMPKYLARAQAHPGGRDAVLSVVVGSEDETGEMARQLEPVSRVVRDVEHGEISKAFAVDGYPAYGILDGDRVVASDFVFARLTPAAPA